MKKLGREEKIAITLSILVAFIFVPTVFLTARDKNSSSSETSTKTSTDKVTLQNTEAILEFGTIDLVHGNGAQATPGDKLYVHYVGQLEDGSVFDTSIAGKKPFVVTLGAGEVIAGWDLGLVGMREGGTRRLTIPSELGYGFQEITDAAGSVVIPADATLVFDVALLRVQ